MNTYSNQFEKLKKSLPESQRAINNFESLVGTRENVNQLYSVDRLYDLLEPSSVRSLSKLISALEEYGFLQRQLLIQSTVLGVIGQYSSLLEVPDQVIDPMLGKLIDVNDDQIEFAYMLTTP